MSRQLDRRNTNINRLTPSREGELRTAAAAVSECLPGTHRIHITSFDPSTGNPAAILSEAAPAESGNYTQRALDHVRNIGRALGFTAAQAAEYVADPDYQRTSSGAVAVHLQQTYKGIPIFQAAKTVRFEPNGAIRETVGCTLTITQEMPINLRITMQQAVLKAAQHVATPQPDELGAKDAFGEPMPMPAVNLAGFEPRLIAVFSEKPDRPAVFEAGPFGDRIKVRLVWFPLNDHIRLTWEVLIAMPAYQGQYRTLVDAESGEILYCRQLVQMVSAQGNVFRVHGGTARQMTQFPRPLADYGLPQADLPAGFPDTWVVADRSAGNSVNAHLGASGPSIAGTIQNGLLTFNPTDPAGNDQKVLNIFYFNCFMHDFFYLLGFRERDGNFQLNNLGRGGLQSDRVDARAHAGAVAGTANMATPVDGLSPVMNMGLVTSTNRHTAMDSSVVFHEFTHGVTNRLVGGPANDRALEAPQSRGMGEGWSDYIPCTINNTTVVGDWVVNDPAGIREFPYNANFPDHFGKLGTGRYTQEHNIGEIWCATLMQMNRNLNNNVLALQLVVDALKLTNANPSFLDARDAILRALDDKRAAGQLTEAQFAAARTAIWAAFAKFGMGPNARSNGAFLTGIVADFNPPGPVPPPPPGSAIRIEARPNLSIPENNATGVSNIITATKTGRLKRLTVFVDIEHTYIGDLRVTLTTPGGKSILLHNRSGGNTDNLVASYRSEDLPALAAVLGDPVQGNWKLHVADLAPQDIGKLRLWALEFDLEQTSQTIHQEAVPGLSIPDANVNGVSSAVAVAQSGIAQGIKVSVDITHTWIGDLRVELVAPSGQAAVLHDQSGNNADNIIRTYDSVTNPALRALSGQAIRGAWTLRVKDLVAQDIGKLNRWSLDLTI